MNRRGIPWTLSITFLLSAGGLAVAQDLRRVDKPETPDLSWVPRKLAKEPAYASAKVRYCIWVLGTGSKSVMTMAWDESGGTGSGYDTLYVDRNFNGDLTGDGEKLFWANQTPAADGKQKAAKGARESYDVRNVRESGGDKVFHFKLRNVYGPDEIEYDSQYRVVTPDGGYEVGPLPGNHKILWSNDLKAAPVYFFGGVAVPNVNGKWAGESLGVWEAGRPVQASFRTVHRGDPPEAELRFYGSKFPGLPKAIRNNRWGRAAYPFASLRVLDEGGQVKEEIPFADSCPCAGGFAPELVIPSRVPPGNHLLVARMLRQPIVGGPAEYVWPVEVRNADFGKPLIDPALELLKKRLAGTQAAFASLRRAEGAVAATGSYPGEKVIPTAVWDNTMDPTNRDWDPRPVNYGTDRLLTVGTKPFSHADSRTLLKFDLSGVPKETEIVAAAIRLTLQGGPSIACKGGAAVQAYGLCRDWNETDGRDGRSCWHGPKFGGSPEIRWTAGGADGAGTDRDATPAGRADVGGFPALLDPADKSGQGPRERSRLVGLDITDLARQWHKGDRPNHGVLLKLAGDGNGTICSSEFLDYPYRPTLVIAYRGPAPQATRNVPADEDMDYARAEAVRRVKPLLLQFYAPLCSTCQGVQATTFADSKVKLVLQRRYQAVRVNAMADPETVKRYGVATVPAVVVLEPDGKKVIGRVGAEELTEAKRFLEALREARSAGE